MPQATQVFNGVMFITNPYEARSFIRVDVLERRFADAIKTKFEDIVESCGQYPELYELLCFIPCAKNLQHFLSLTISCLSVRRNGRASGSTMSTITQ